MKKDNHSDPSTHIVQLRGGLKLEMNKNNTYFDMKWLDIIKKCQKHWFYCEDVPVPSSENGLPPYLPDRLVKNLEWNPKVSKSKQVDVAVLIKIIGALKLHGIINPSNIVNILCSCTKE